MKCLLSSFFFLFLGSMVLAQSDLELAEYYFNNGDFEEAKLYYEQIYKSNRSNAVYENYLATLVALEELDEAEKIVKKKLKSSKKKSNLPAF